jgi:hypothetical protein
MPDDSAVPAPTADVHHHWTGRLYHVAAYIDTELTDPVRRHAVEVFLESALEVATKVWLQP